MSKKWADKLIDGVSFNFGHTHIEFVRSRNDLGDSVGSSAEKLSRSQVISLIKSGVTFSTIFSDNGKWKLGAALKVVSIAGQEFLKTVPDYTTKDNLDNLPEF